MRIFCAIGLHRWHTREATARPGTFVHRCRTCLRVSVRHRRKRLATDAE